ncbi:MAG TPA: hypothetical protein VIG51_04310 [Candidatus Baltobacteraceae bacterium]
MQKIPALFAALALATMPAACGGGGAGGGGYTPGGSSGGAAPRGVGALTIGLALPTGTIGYETDPAWGKVGGFTQDRYSQVLAFAPGTTITIENVSSGDAHTLNVIGSAQGPPATFPAHPPALSTAANGNGTLGANYTSGLIEPGATVRVVLSHPGTYLLACAIHYINTNMRDVIQVSANATPGPQAAPPSGGIGGCKGVYC